MNRETRRQLGVKRISTRKDLGSDSHRTTGSDFGLSGSSFYDPTSSSGSTYNPNTAINRPPIEESAASEHPKAASKPGQESWAGVVFHFLSQFPIGLILWFIAVIFFARFFMQSVVTYREKEGYPANLSEYMGVFTTALIPESSLLGVTILLGVPLLFYLAVKGIWHIAGQRKTWIVTLYLLLGIALCVFVEITLIRIFGIHPSIRSTLGI